MAETEIAGIIVPAVVTDDLVAKPVVDLLIEKYKAGKDSLSLADMHEVLNYGLERLLALRRVKEREVSSRIEQKDPTVVYKIWKRHVSDIEKEATSLNTKHEEVKEKKRKHSRRKSRLIKKIKMALSEVIKLLDDECPKEILVGKLRDPVIRETDVPSITEYPTLQKAFQDIQTLLQSDGVKCLALNGQTGVGKTTIMQHLNNHFCDNVDFEVVIFIKMNADDEQIDLYILQKIAERIRVDAEGHEYEVVGRIQKVLENKRYLLILDGLRNRIDGIWEMLDISKDKKHSKVVIGSDDYTLRGMRCVDKTVELGRLSRTEAWKMFRHTLGHTHLPPTTKLASRLEGESSSKSSPNAIGKQHLVQDVLRLMRTQDFVYLMLSYPMRIGYEKEFLEQWINDVYELSFADDPDIDSFWRRVERLLYDESPLRYIALIPQNITTEIIKGGSVSRETALKHVPKPILLLATHLALHQLSLTLTSDTIYYWWLARENIKTIWFSTRNDAEKRAVVENVKANSQIRAAFDDLEIIDLNQIDDVTKRELVLLNLERRLEQNTKYRRSRHLVLVVDGDGDKKADPLRVSLPMNDSKNVVVFITTLSSSDYLTSKVDLTIKTEDHLLPWELFCNIVGSELLHSSIAIQEIAVQIVEKCRGHLLAIILMAKALKHVTDVQLWELALQKLLYRDREAIVNALIFKIIWANEMSEREKACLIRCLMVIKFQDCGKMSDDQLFARWFSQKLVRTKKEAKSILKNFMECSLLLQFEGTQGGHIILPEDIKIIFYTIRQDIPENLSDGALISTIPNLQVLNLSYTHLRYLYNVTTDPQLQNMDLSGSPMETLPGATCKLKTLEILWLVGCLQLRELLPQIVELENLKELRLKGCERLETLAQEIWELHKLETLSLEQCSQLLELSPRIAKLENLKKLRLAGCTRLKALPEEIWRLHKLETLSLEQCSQFQKLPTQIAKLENLKELRLAGCTRLEALPKEIWRLHKLETLSLEQCSLLLELSPQIAKLKNLKELRLAGCSRLEALPEEIWELHKLETLSLEQCSQLQELPPRIIELKNLKELRLVGCTRLEALPQEIWQLYKLETLSLEQFSHLLELSPWIAEIENLKELRLVGCTRLKALPEEIWRLHKLETLSLEQCSQLQKLPTQIAELENLKELRLAGCTRLEALPEEIWRLHKLETLSLERCSQLQKLPTQIAELENLKELRLAGCTRLGALPQEIWRLYKLETLSLEQWQLLKLSPWVAELENLIELRLVGCTRMETLPQEIWRLYKLETLSLEQCSQLLELSPWIADLENLKELRLVGCTQLKALPDEIRQLHKLETLSLEQCSQLLEMSPQIAELENLKELRLTGCT